MGNCVTCNNTPASSPTIDFVEAIANAQENMVTQDPKDIPIESKRIHNQVHRHSLTTFDHQSNGNAKNSLPVETGGSLHRDKSLRILCSRIQPLTRVGSHRCEGKTSKDAKNNIEVTKSDNNSQKQLETINEAKINALFDCYRDAENTDLILADGMDRLLNDLHLAPEEFKVLVLAWRLDASCMCQFTREEFINGMRLLHADSLPQLQNRLIELTNKVLQNPELFKDLYRFTFRFGLDRGSGQRILPVDVAVCLWRVVFSVRQCPLLDGWLTYLNCHPVNGIPRDTWDMFLHLTEAVGDDLTNYDDSHAWPSVFDDFVEYEIDRLNQNVKGNNCEDSNVSAIRYNQHL